MDLVISFLAETIVSQLIQKIPNAIMSTIMQRRRENGGGGSTVLAELFDRDLQERSKDEMVDKSKQLLTILGSVVMAAKGRKVNGPLLEWLGDIVEGMYQGQYMVDIMRHQSNSSTSYDDKRDLLDSLNKLEDLNSKIDLFYKILKPCGYLDTCVTNYLNMDDDKLFGRLVEKGKLINFLLGLDDNSGNFGNVDVLTITGAEGVGKSALVEYFYNETWVRNHFSLRVWLGNISLHEPAHFINELLNQFSSNNVATDRDDVEQMLTGKTFLLVIENASDINERVWTVIKAYLEYGNKGSKVLITSRRDETTGLGTAEPIILDPMTKGEYCCFLKKIVFGRNRPEGYAKLAKIAKEIAYFLNGYPWAAKVMAARLLENVNIHHWENILKSIKPAVRIQYTHFFLFFYFFLLLFIKIYSSFVPLKLLYLGKTPGWF